MTIKIKNKYNYLCVIQGYYASGWEDVSEYKKTDWKNARADLKEYRASRTGAYRIIGRREKCD